MTDPKVPGPAADAAPASAGTINVPEAELRRARFPIISTIIVALAVALMIGLGLWQLDRARQKDELQQVWNQNLHLPVTAYPSANVTDESYLFRTVSANCLAVVGWRSMAGNSIDGRSGWRHVAACRTGAEGPGLLVDMGVNDAPAEQPVTPAGVAEWRGGPVRGIVTTEPDQHSALARLWAKATGQPIAPLQLMIVSQQPAPGLTASAAPNPENVPSNHRSYAFQWFAFAGIAALIYGLLLRYRWLARRK